MEKLSLIELLINKNKLIKEGNHDEKLIVDLLVDMPDNYVFFILNKTSRYNSPSIGLIQRVNNLSQIQHLNHYNHYHHNNNK